MQAPAIISFQIENGKFIKKMINLSYRSVDIRKFTLSILKRYRKDGQYDKKNNTRRKILLLYRFYHPFRYETVNLSIHIELK